MENKRRLFILSILGIIIILSFLFGGERSSTVHFGIIADVHKDIMHDADERLNTFISEMNSKKVDFIIQLGDFCRPYSYNDGFLNIWNSFEGPVFHVLGNHDMDGGFSRSQTMAYWGMPKKYYAFDQKGFHFVVLDGNDVTNPPQDGYAHFIGDKQKEWLKQELKTNKSPVIIFSHQSIQDIWSVANGDEIRSILETNNKNPESGNVIVCFNGHSHFDGSTKQNGIWYVEINSMSYQWLGSDYLHVRYSREIDSLFPWIKYTAPYKEPLYTDVTISGKGKIKIRGRSTDWVGPSPWELNYPRDHEVRMVPWISDQVLNY